MQVFYQMLKMLHFNQQKDKKILNRMVLRGAYDKFPDFFLYGHIY